MSAHLITIPVRTVSAANLREHWRAKAARVKKERTVTRLVCLAGLRPLEGHGLIDSVTFTRVAPRLLDSDNLQIGLKAIRDELARFMGVSDAPSGGVLWVYCQAKGAVGEYSVVVEITTHETSPSTCHSDQVQAGLDTTEPPLALPGGLLGGASGFTGRIRGSRGSRVSRNQ